MILSKTAVEAQESIRAKDGTVVQSDRTVFIAERFLRLGGGFA